jgi:hypothetical protein
MDISLRHSGGDNFEREIESCLLVLTQADGGRPAGPTIWKGEGLPPAGMVT